jgi:hypothetical protein
MVPCILQHIHRVRLLDDLQQFAAGGVSDAEGSDTAKSIML